MSLFYAFFHLLAVATLGTADVLSQEPGRVAILLRQHRRDANIMPRAPGSGSNQLAVASTEKLDTGFWFGNFDVGEAKNLSLLIDTGSWDTAVNPKSYKPSAQSVDLHRGGEIGFSGTQTNDCGSFEANYQVYTDTVSMEGLVAHNQTLAALVQTPPPNSYTITEFPHDGIVGFSGASADGTQLNGVPFFQNLCNQGAIKECRFGLAFGTSGIGQQILGGVEDDLFEGQLAPLSEENGKATLVAEYTGVGKISVDNSTVVLDSGTANIVGTRPVVRRLFESLGLEIGERKEPGCGSVIYGYYPCDSPPNIGFRFGGSDSQVFDIEPSAFALADNGDNNCTAIITGETRFDMPDWLVGQAWFQGKYLDFLHGGRSASSGRDVRVAILKDKSGGDF